MIDVPKDPRFQVAVAVLSAPVAYWLFDRAGFDWSDSFLGWVIFLSADAGMTSFVASTLSIVLLLRRRWRRG